MIQCGFHQEKGLGQHTRREKTGKSNIQIEGGVRHSFFTKIVLVKETNKQVYIT